MESPRECGVWGCGFAQTTIDLSSFAFSATGLFGLTYCLIYKAVPDALFITICCNACLWGFGSYMWHVYGGAKETESGVYTFPYAWVMHVDGLCMMLGTHLNAVYAYSALLLQYAPFRVWQLRLLGVGWIVIFAGLATALLLLASTDRGHERWNTLVQIFSAVAVVLHVGRVVPFLSRYCSNTHSHTYSQRTCCSWQYQTIYGFVALLCGFLAFLPDHLSLFSDDKYSTFFHTVYHVLIAVGLYLLAHSTFEQINEIQTSTLEYTKIGK